MKNYTEIKIVHNYNRSMKLALGMTSDVTEVEGGFRYRLKAGTIFSLDCLESHKDQDCHNYYVLQAPEQYIQIDENSDLKDCGKVLLHISGKEAVSKIREKLENIPLENTLVPEIYPILALLVEHHVEKVSDTECGKDDSVASL